MLAWGGRRKPELRLVARRGGPCSLSWQDEMQPEQDSRGVTVRIALGGNLGAAHETLRRGWDAVVATLPLQQARLSTIIASAPAEGASGGTFANAVGVGYTALDAHACLAALLQIERAFGRDRAREGHHGARPLDLDILDWDGALMNSPTLQLPHPRSHGRLFVLEPWAELEPSYRCACCGRTIAALLERCRTTDQAAAASAADASGGPLS
jgi:2-amino-4-hydroxy-6-hydroxymethyldihydropteridine diphosphokinase